MSEIEKIARNSISRGEGTNYKLERDGLWTQPGNYIQQMLTAHEEQVWYDVAFTVKELASSVSNPTMSFHHFKKFIGYLKKTMDNCLYGG